MARGIVDTEGLNEPDVVALRKTSTRTGCRSASTKSGTWS